MSNQGCKIKAETININSNKPFPYHYSILVSKCRGILNNINNPYAKLCVPCVIKDINVKVFNLMSRTNETHYIEWHETCACKCRLNASVCNKNDIGITINLDMNVKNWLSKVDVIMDLFGILVYVNVNVINHIT